MELITGLIFLCMLLGTGYWCFRQSQESEALDYYKSDLVRPGKSQRQANKHNGPPSVLRKQDRSC